MSAIYEENKDEDGYLHITYSGEESLLAGKSRSASFSMAESSFKNKYPQEITQAEENNPYPAPMIVENSATIDIPDIGKKK
ncbi:unnamed protein product, partial [Prunus brigantina]